MVSGRWPYASGCEGSRLLLGRLHPRRSTGEPLRTADRLPPGPPGRRARTWTTPSIERGRRPACAAPGPTTSSCPTCSCPTTTSPTSTAPAARRHTAVPPAALQPSGVQQGRRGHRRRPRRARRLRRAGRRRRRRSMTGALLRERPQAQMAMAEAEARLRSARAFVFEAVDTVWAGDVRRRRSPPPRSRQWCAWRARTAAPKRCEPWRSSTPRPASPPASPSSPLERAIRDVRVVPQHIMVAPSRHRRRRSGAARPRSPRTPIF